MTDEINVLQRTQIINVDPETRSVSIIMAGPQGPPGPGGGGDSIWEVDSSVLEIASDFLPEIGSVHISPGGDFSTYIQVSEESSTSTVTLFAGDHVTIGSNGDLIFSSGDDITLTTDMGGEVTITSEQVHIYGGPGPGGGGNYDIYDDGYLDLGSDVGISLHTSSGEQGIEIISDHLYFRRPATTRTEIDVYDSGLTPSDTETFIKLKTPGNISLDSDGEVITQGHRIPFTFNLDDNLVWNGSGEYTLHGHDIPPGLLNHDGDSVDHYQSGRFQSGAALYRWRFYLNDFPGGSPGTPILDTGAVAISGSGYWIFRTNVTRHDVNNLSYSVELTSNVLPQPLYMRVGTISGVNFDTTDIDHVTSAQTSGAGAASNQIAILQKRAIVHPWGY